MSGFGYDHFGDIHFGEWGWSKHVLFDLIPEIYREMDASYGDVLKKLQYGLRPSFDLIKRKIGGLPKLRDPLVVRTQYDEVEPLVLGPEVVTQGQLLQRGTDGTVSAIQEFEAKTGRFRFDDVGKDLILSGSSINSNNRTVRVARVLSPSKILTEPQLAANPSFIRWELRTPVEAKSGVRVVEVLQGSVSSVRPGWVLDDGLAQYVVSKRQQFDRANTSRAKFVLQEGLDGTFDSSGYLIVSSGSFTASDIGRKIVVSSGGEPDNRGTWEIAQVVGTTPPFQLQLVESSERLEDSSAYYWGVLPRAELELEISELPRGVSEQNGVIGVLTTSFASSGSSFDSDDVGKLLTIRGSLLGNNGTYQVTGFLAPNNLSLSPAFVPETGLTWDLRRPTGLDDPTEVQVYAPSLIQHLAKDFGIEIDFRESERIQRSWVKHVSRWINIKGTAQGYRVVGLLTGLEIEAQALYRVSQEIFEGISSSGYSAFLVESGEAELGRYGFSGALTWNGAQLVFTDLGASFLTSDVGRHVRVRSSGDPFNQKLYTIAEYVSSTVVKFRPLLDTASTPDYGAGGTITVPTIDWSVVRLYATVAPTRPKFDDFNSDILNDIIDGNPETTDNFSIDRYCWETGFSTQVPFNFVSVVASGDYTWTVNVQTPGGQPGSAEVIAAVGSWVLYDAVGTRYFVDSIPTGAHPNWSFQVFGTEAPATVGPSAPRFQYECEPDFSCSYCPSNKILLKVALGAELSSEVGLAVENILLRAIQRVEQAKPAHVEIVQRFTRDLTATLSLSASVEPHPWIFASLYAPLSPYYDDIPGDAIEPDFQLSANLDVIVTP